jgi:hypothetical protein
MNFTAVRKATLSLSLSEILQNPPPAEVVCEENGTCAMASADEVWIEKKIKQCTMSWTEFSTLGPWKTKTTNNVDEYILPCAI